MYALKPRACGSEVSALADKSETSIIEIRELILSGKLGNIQDKKYYNLQEEEKKPVKVNF